MTKAKHSFKRVVRPVRPEDEVVTAFRDGQVTLRTNRRTAGFTESIMEIGYQGIRKGDLVIHAMDAFAGAIGVSDSDGKSTPVYSACISIKGDNPEYFAMLLRYVSRTGYLQAIARGIRERSTDFRYEHFANLQLPIPPLSEQTAIVSQIESDVAIVNAARERATQEIGLARELWASLVAEVVTGKRDVRSG